MSSMTERELDSLRTPETPMTLSEWARRTGEIRNNARSVLLSTLQAEQISEIDTDRHRTSEVFRLPDGSLATLTAEGAVVFWGKP